MQHPKCCTKNLTVFKFDPTSSNMLQHIATYRNRMAKRTHHVVPNNVARCCVEMLRAFGQALNSLFSLSKNNNRCFKEGFQCAKCLLTVLSNISYRNFAGLKQMFHLFGRGLEHAKVTLLWTAKAQEVRKKIPKDLGELH